MEIKPFGDGARITKGDEMNLSEMVSESAARWVRAVALEARFHGLTHPDMTSK
jgi:hypothetical protein